MTRLTQTIYSTLTKLLGTLTGNSNSIEKKKVFIEEPSQILSGYHLCGALSDDEEDHALFI